MSLAFIAVVTALIGDLASHAGCSITLKDSVTAITFVALGTSLPDTFASKAAAQADPTADAAIGNVTGSNSVNVFLGLGMPWFIAAVYWESQPEFGQVATADMTGPAGEWYRRYIATGKMPAGSTIGFAAPADGLSYSVGVFSTCALICICTILLRRKLFKAELGGPPGPAKASSALMIGLWFIYILMSALKAYNVL